MEKINFERVGIICKETIAKDVKTLTSVIRTFEKLGAKILLDEKGAAAMRSVKATAKTTPKTASKTPSNKKYTSLTREKVCALSTLLITLGGDGTLLRTARYVSTTPHAFPPVLSINIGRLGFLTQSTPDELTRQLKLIQAGKYKIDTRSLLDITLKKRDGTTHHSIALNDAVINQGAFARLIKLSIQIDKLPAASFKADGLIVATPSGSTGHSLSAGGPVIHPKVDGIVITPICPVLLSMRPIVIPDSRTIRIKIETTRRSSSAGADPVPGSREAFYHLGLTIDGQQTYELDYEDEISITRAPQQLHLIRTLERNYYKTLNEKLGWGHEK